MSSLKYNMALVAVIFIGSNVYSRDLSQSPFSTVAPFNTRLSTSAVFEAATDGCSADLTASGYYNGIVAANYGHAVVQSSNSDPLRKLYGIQAGKVVLDKKILVPDSAIPSGPSSPAFKPYVYGKSSGKCDLANWADCHLHVITPDHLYVDEMWQTQRRTTGDFDMALSFIGNRYGWFSSPRIALTSSGWGQGGARANGSSALAGLIRTGELTEGIRHTVTIAVPLEKEKNSWVWPATTNDGWSASSYKGRIPMGQLAGIPSNIDLTQLSPKLSMRGLVLARALQEYGLYVADTSSDYSFSAEVAAQSDAGMLDGTTELGRIRSLLRCVKNNTQSTPGGGNLCSARVPSATGAPIWVDPIAGENFTSLTLQPVALTLALSGTGQINAQVNGATNNTAIVWCGNGVTVTNGSIKAPAQAGTYSVKAVNPQNPAQAVSAIITVQ